MKERLKQLRKALDLTQQQIADRIGIKRNSYANYETGRNTPIDAIILSLCREFNINEDWLRFGVGEMFNETEYISLDDFAKSHNMNDLDKEIIMCYLSIPSNIRNSFINYVKEYFSIEEKIKSPTEKKASELLLAEEEYIKSNLNSARKTNYSALSSTDDTERKIN